MPNRPYTSCLVLLFSLIAACQPQALQYDLVLEGGRVMDPESGLDAIRNVGITAGRIEAISAEPLTGRSVVDVSSLVVAPGFIDLHSHAWTPLGQRFQLQDGVTTTLELESGAYPVAEFGIHEPIAIAGKSLTNFGASLGHAWIRSRILEGDDAVPGFDALVARALTGGAGLSMERPAFREPLSAGQLVQLEEYLHEGLDQGGLGIGMLLDYMSEVVTDEELRVIFDVAAERGAPVIVHIRRGVAGDPAGLEEVIALARDTGAAVHVCHLQASAMGGIEEFLRLIREARAAGVMITTESFPYNAGSTSISAAVFNRNWQEIFAIGYEDVEWVATGERLTEATWNEYREKYPGGSVIHHYNREEWTRIATEAPDVIVAADGVPVITTEQKVAPFGIGTFSRVLGHYARDEGTIDLMAAIAKMTILPARVLEGYAPALAKKGRVAVGADADLTVFDANEIRDNATFREPFRQSSGIAHVIVGGTFVLRDGNIVEDVYPGRRVLR
jgi:N-acyl-D-aspartate/D-glutamate deacylase